MKNRGAVLVVALACGLLLVTAGAWAQQVVKVGVGGEKLSVVREGDTVRLGSGGVVAVTGDWRNAGTRIDLDDNTILVDLGATEEAGRMHLNLAGDILFDFDSTAIRPDAATQLAKLAYVIRNRSTGQIEVVGYTDSIGAADYNQRLSEARALAVIHWLNAREGIPADIMVARGMGAAKPVAYNTMPDGSDNPTGRAQNRRVEVQFATVEPGTRVQVGGTAVQVEPGQVNVGGVTVRTDGADVHVGHGGDQVTVRGTGTGAGSVGSSEAGESFICPGGQTCNKSCSYGDCSMTCAGGASCNFTCSGGDCQMSCATGASCKFSCSGGDCMFTCAVSADCITSCSGGECSCTGPGC